MIYGKKVDKGSLVEDIKGELKPLSPYMKAIRINGKIAYQGIALKDDVTFTQLKNNGIILSNTTKKQFIELLDWFNQNREAFDKALNELSK